MVRSTSILAAILLLAGCASYPRQAANTGSVRTAVGDLIMNEYRQDEERKRIKIETDAYTEAHRDHSPNQGTANNVFPGMLPEGVHAVYLGNGSWGLTPGI